ncbi:GAF domain-containing SpoIIE family protein phosphatase [Pseudonocardia sp. ICBG1293]|uniref:GAF domain-containing SpoIIE family protein phosphatase n=1 Tax=Pseudonocardia sp. ICBG1293 TaxID=2844382 RepID=UPI001CCB57DC|nr:GAF domain-containing SpoIIE family protein phosphatase [Pseudonocardia sp. ICBG1293]
MEQPAAPHDIWPRCEALYAPERLAALQHLGLGPARDVEMDRFADWVRDALAVPTALVTLVRADRQVFPGRSGLPEPFASSGETPLSHSFCRHVVTSGSPLLITDARTDARVRDNLAIPDIGVVAYAGMPLTDDEGNVLGSLCAIDSVPRTWSPDGIRTLERIARSCSTELRLRLRVFDAGAERDRRDVAESVAQDAHDRSRVLLAASQHFTDTVTVRDVRDRIDMLLRGELGPAHVETVLRDDSGRLHTLPAGSRSVHETADGDVDAAAPHRTTRSPLTSTPTALAMREQRVVHYRDRGDLASQMPAEVSAAVAALGLDTVVAAPVPGPDRPAGAILLGWSRPDAVRTADLLTITTIAGYAGQALARARALEHRALVARQMQDAMLTALPAVAGLSMAVRYSPADDRLDVGGDWYDCLVLADPGRPAERIVSLSFGDIAGHDLPAVTMMGQVRSMLRQAAWDHPGGPPSAVLSAFEQANHGLGLGAGGTAIVARLRPVEGGSWSMAWTNAGHPPPVLVHPDGSAELLDAHDALFGYEFALGLPRTDHRRTVEPGSTLVLYTDGVVERRGSDIDRGIDRLLSQLAGAHDHTPDAIIDRVTATRATGSGDDAAVLVVRFGAADR